MRKESWSAARLRLAEILAIAPERVDEVEPIVKDVVKAVLRSDKGLSSSDYMGMAAAELAKDESLTRVELAYASSIASGFINFLINKAKADA